MEHFPIGGTSLTSDKSIRALADKVKQSTETAVCESMHGGVRGRGSNPLTYLIVFKASNCKKHIKFVIIYFLDSLLSLRTENQP